MHVWTVVEVEGEGFEVEGGEMRRTEAREAFSRSIDRRFLTMTSVSGK